MKTRNPIAKAVRKLRTKVKPNTKRAKLDAVMDKIRYYISEHPETKAVFERLEDR